MVQGKIKKYHTDLIVGADGIRSAVRNWSLGAQKTPLNYLDCMVILGICSLDHIQGVTPDLLDGETVFQTANGKERIYVMPYDKTSIMWQLSFPIHEDAAKILRDLGMPNAQFKIEVVLGESYLSNGKDELSFLFSANKGGVFNTLKKSASGGELARIMLAIKSILAKYVQLPAIMFDEIDTGVSGEISNKMAQIMQSMSQCMQVFAITHLPQIAAKGHTHFKVFKDDLNDITTTHLVELNHDDRIVEIAQMLGGINISNSALAHAKQLLN